MIDSILINLYGGPGCGKSTLASRIFSFLKKQGYIAELTGEFAKDSIYDDNLSVFNDQYYIFGNQYHRVKRLWNKVQYIISDSPVLLCPIYNKEKDMLFEKFVYNADKKFKQINIFINRNENLQYKTEARNENEKEAKIIDNKIKNMLNKYAIPYVSIEINDTVQINKEWWELLNYAYYLKLLCNLDKYPHKI